MKETPAFRQWPHCHGSAQFATFHVTLEQSKEIPFREWLEVREVAFQKSLGVASSVAAVAALVSDSLHQVSPTSNPSRCCLVTILFRLLPCLTSTSSARCQSEVINHTCFRVGHCFRHHFFDLDISAARLLRLPIATMFQSQVPLETMAASAEAAQYLAEKVRSSLGARASSELRGLPQPESFSQTCGATSSESRRFASHPHRERATLASAQ